MNGLFVGQGVLKQNSMSAHQKHPDSPVQAFWVSLRKQSFGPGPGDGPGGVGDGPGDGPGEGPGVAAVAPVGYDADCEIPHMFFGLAVVPLAMRM